MNLDYVLNRLFPPMVQTYDARDSSLYALSLGIGDDPLDEDELPYVYEGRGPLAVPSQCVTLGWPAFWHDEPGAAIAWRRILHGEQSFTLHRPLPVEGTIRANYKILAVEDKGPARGALIHFATEIVDARDGAALASLRAVQFLRDDGGSGDFGSPPPREPAFVFEGEPTASIIYPTSPRAPLLYRQASRDYMPIHADPEIARAAGFDRPISHGLNTFGLACRAILNRFAPRTPARLRAMSARFVAPAFPGEFIRVDMFARAGDLHFRATAVERNVLVIDRGACQLRR